MRLQKCRQIGRQPALPSFASFDLQRRGMKGVARQEKLTREILGPAGLDEFQIKRLVRPVNLVAYHGMAGEGEMHADLMGAAGVGNSPNELKRSLSPPPKRRSTWKSVWAGAPAGWISCFNQIRAGPLAPCRAIGKSTECVSHSGQPHVDREIFLRDPLLLHHQPETPRGTGVLGHQNEPAGFAVQAVDDRNLAAVGDLESEQMLQVRPKACERCLAWWDAPAEMAVSRPR